MCFLTSLLLPQVKKVKQIAGPLRRTRLRDRRTLSYSKLGWRPLATWLQPTSSYSPSAQVNWFALLRAIRAASMTPFVYGRKRQTKPVLNVLNHFWHFVTVRPLMAWVGKLPFSIELLNCLRKACVTGSCKPFGPAWASIYRRKRSKKGPLGRTRGLKGPMSSESWQPPRIQEFEWDRELLNWMNSLFFKAFFAMCKGPSIVIWGSTDDPEVASSSTHCPAWKAGNAVDWSQYIDTHCKGLAPGTVCQLF